MRKTIYDSYVKTYVTCEERCALARLIHYVNNMKVDNDYTDFLDLSGRIFVAKSDLQALKDLADFVYDKTPFGVCVSVGIDEKETHVKRVKEAE